MPVPDRPLVSQPIELFGQFQTYAPSLEEMLELLFSNFTGQNIPKSQPVRALNIEVVLPPEEAAKGGHIPIRIPLLEPCPACGGRGRLATAACDQCQGRGLLRSSGQVDVLVPRGTADGTVIPVSLRHMGIQNMYLNMHIRVSPTQ